MGTFTYQLDDETPIHFNYAIAQQGVIVLRNMEGEPIVIPSADVHYELCKIRFVDNPQNVNLKIMPVIFLCESESGTIPLHQLKYIVQDSLKSRKEFEDIFRSDETIKKDVEVKRNNALIEKQLKEREIKEANNKINALLKKQEAENQKELLALKKKLGIREKRKPNTDALKYKM
tara:strand:+ start:590 stop:1114 length:525 start_codon:yes stop_codon:yes gene_type:complete